MSNQMTKRGGRYGGGKKNHQKHSMTDDELLNQAIRENKIAQRNATSSSVSPQSLNGEPSYKELQTSYQEKLAMHKSRRIGEEAKRRAAYVKEHGGPKQAKKDALIEAEKQVDLMFQQFGMNPQEQASMRSRLLSAIKNNDTKTMESIIQSMQNEMGVSGLQSGSGLGNQSESDQSVQQAERLKNLQNLTIDPTLPQRSRGSV